MQNKVTKEDLRILDEIWSKVKKATIKIIKERLKDKEDIDLNHMIPHDFARNLILGNGKWGIVLGIPAIPELVIKLTTDPFEWFLIEMLRQDKELEYHPALPFTVGTAILDVKLDDMPLYLIVRENLIIGVPLDKTNPLTKAKDTLISDFIEPMEEIEEEVASALRKRMLLSLLDVSTAYSIISGEMKRQLVKALAKLPIITKESEYYWVLDLQKKLLERGIALVDIHPNNLGRREYEVPYYVKNDLTTGRGCIVVSDLGMAYGTPIFLEKGMLYKGFDEMIEHFVKIYKTYSDLRYKSTNQSKKTSRTNPAIDETKYIEYMHETIKIVCDESNATLNNVLTDPNLEVVVSAVAGKIMKLTPKMHISAQMIEFSLRNSIASVVFGWINEGKEVEITQVSIKLKGYVDNIHKGIVKCSIANEYYCDDERPIGLFEIPKTDPIYPIVDQTVHQLLARNKRLGLEDELVQYFPVAYLKKMNGVEYEGIRSTKA